MHTLTREEKERLLRALEEDREFRYALMGLLGFREVLDRITKLEERQQKLEERQQRLEERFAKLEERFAKLEERFVELEKRFLQLEERVARIEERMARIEEEVKETRRVLIAISHRFGVLSEASFREAMKFVVEEVLGAAKVERKMFRDEEGIVYGHPAMVEVDVVVRDKEHILIEIKSTVSRSDVAELYRIGKLYEKLVGVKPRLLIIGGFIDPRAWDTAAKLGVEIRPVFRESTET